jgi:hypothetical protein
LDSDRRCDEVRLGKSGHAVVVAVVGQRLVDAAAAACSSGHIGTATTMGRPRADLVLFGTAVDSYGGLEMFGKSWNNICLRSTNNSRHGSLET